MSDEPTSPTHKRPRIASLETNTTDRSNRTPKKSDPVDVSDVRTYIDNAMKKLGKAEKPWLEPSFPTKEAGTATTPSVGLPTPPVPPTFSDAAINVVPAVDAAAIAARAYPVCTRLDGTIMNKNAAIVFTENAVKPFVDVFNHTDYTFHSLDSESHLNILKSQILSVTSEISGSYGVPVWKAAVSAHLSTEMDLFKTRGEGAHTVVYCGAMKVVKATVSILQTSITLNSSIEDMLEKSLTLESDDAKRGALHHVFTTVGYFVALDFKIGGLLFGSQAAEKYATTEDKVTKFVTNFRGAVSAVLEVLTGNASVGAKGGVKNSLDSTDLTSAFSFKWHSLGGSCLNDITRPTGWAKSVSDSWAVIECSNAVPIYKLSRNEALKTEIERLMRSAPPELITSHVQTRYHLKGDRGKSDYKDSEFTDDPSHAMRLHAVKIWYGTYIDSIQAVYQTPDGLVEGPRHGGTGGTPHIFTLGDEEFIVEVRGRAKEYLERLSFTTNRGSFKEFGQSGPDTCAVTLRPVVGFAGQYCYCKEVPYVLTALGFLCL